MEHMKKELFLWIVMGISNSEKIWMAEVGLSSREFGAVECNIYSSGLILSVPV